MATRRVGRIRTRQQRLPLDQLQFDLGDLSVDPEDVDAVETLVEAPDVETVSAVVDEPDPGEIAAAEPAPELTAALDEVLAREAAQPEVPEPEPAVAEPEPAVVEAAAETPATSDDGDAEPERLKIPPVPPEVADAETVHVAVPTDSTADSALATPARGRPASRRLKRVPTPKPFVARAAATPPDADTAETPHPEPVAMEQKKSPRAANAAAPASSPPPVDASLGESLRQAREAAGYSIPQVAELSHIRMDYVKALENDDYTSLPAAAIYTKSYIKSLCRQYRIDPDPLLALYDSRPGGTAPPPPVAPAETIEEPVAADTGPDPNLNARVPGFSGRHLAWAAAAMLAIIAVILVVGVSKRLLGGSGKEAVAAITDEQVLELVPSPTIPVRELQVPAAR